MFKDEIIYMEPFEADLGRKASKMDILNYKSHCFCNNFENSYNIKEKS